MTRNGYYVVLDFDGTVVKHRYPAVGEDIGAVPPDFVTQKTCIL